MEHIKRFGELNNIKYKVVYDEDRYEINAYVDDKEIGNIVCEVIFNIDYELGDDFTNDEIDEMFPEQTVVKIEHISIEDEYKGVGIAKKLMKKMLYLMKKNGFNQFYLNASPMGFGGLRTNSLVEFYKKFDFKVLLDQGHNVLMYLIY